MIIAFMPLFIYEIAFCFLISLFLFSKRTLADKMLPMFFFCLLVLECYCAWLYKKNEGTDHIYNFFFPVEYAFYCFYISSYTKRSNKANTIKTLIIVYLTFTIIYYAFFADLSKFSSLTYLCGFLILLIAILFKLYEILTQEIINNPLKNEMFWFVMGLLIVNLGGFFRFGAANYLYQNNDSLHDALQKLNIYLTVVQYLFFIIFFYLRWRKTNSHT